jgi:hypothetical protein
MKREPAVWNLLRPAFVAVLWTGWDSMLARETSWSGWNDQVVGVPVDVRPNQTRNHAI